MTQSISRLNQAEKRSNAVERHAIECKDALGHFFAEKSISGKFRCARVGPCNAAPAGYYLIGWFHCDVNWVNQHALQIDRDPHDVH